MGGHRRASAESAAPQVGISRAAAIVLPPDPGAEPVVMLNPQVIRVPPCRT